MYVYTRVYHNLIKWDYKYVYLLLLKDVYNIYKFVRGDLGVNECKLLKHII